MHCACALRVVEIFKRRSAGAREYANGNCEDRIQVRNFNSNLILFAN